MRYFDLHCDTITTCLNNQKELYKNDLHIDLKRAEYMKTYIQCYAAFVPDSMEGEKAFFYFCQTAEKLNEEIVKNKEKIIQLKESTILNKVLIKGLFGAILTVENGKALGGKLENIAKMKKLGVKMMTLTWNGENELGRGVLSNGKTGLTDFGRKAVEMLEAAGIVIDVSHASKELFYDVAEIANKPFVASHSNATRICSHPRNLTDEQIQLICQRGGIIGLNFYRGFLNNNGEKASIDDILRHAEHFLSLGGENALAIGGDLDGADLPKDMKGIESIGEIYERFLRENYKETLIEKIFYKNAESFFYENYLL